jgi:hypothetical protein
MGRCSFSQRSRRAPPSPARRRPSADENLPIRQSFKVPQQSTANSSSLTVGTDIGMTDQSDVLYVLETHHAAELTVSFHARPKRDASSDVTLELKVA